MTTGTARRAYRIVLAFALWTAFVWGNRIVNIFRNDHEAGFVVVHVGLAVVSIGLGVAAVLAVRVLLRERDVERDREAPAAAAGLQELVDR